MQRDCVAGLEAHALQAAAHTAGFVVQLGVGVASETAGLGAFDDGDGGGVGLEAAFGDVQPGAGEPDARGGVGRLKPVERFEVGLALIVLKILG